MRLVLLSSWTWFRTHHGPNRTGRGGRTAAIKFYELRDNLHGPPGDSYFVRVHVRLRICAVRGIAEVVFNETKRAGDYTFARHTRTIKFRQRSRCETHRFKWRLRDKFFGVGTYSVKATAWDKDSQFSKTVSRKKVTAD